MLLPYLIQAAQDARPLFVEGDIIVLAVYIISVVYIFFRAIKSLEGKVVIEFQREKLQKKLVAQDLKDFIGIEFKIAEKESKPPEKESKPPEKESKPPSKKKKKSDKKSGPSDKEICAIEKFIELGITIKNQLSENSIYIYWDKSVLTDINSRSRRVLRWPQSSTLDVLQVQVPSVIMPQRNLNETLVPETSLTRTGDSLVLQPTKPLIDVGTFKKASDKRHEFTLKLDISVATPADPAPVHRRYTLPCEFSVRKLTWQDVIPWKLK